MYAGYSVWSFSSQDNDQLGHLEGFCVFSFKKRSQVGGSVLIFCEQYLFTCVAVLLPQHMEPIVIHQLSYPALGSVCSAKQKEMAPSKAQMWKG